MMEKCQKTPYLHNYHFIFAGTYSGLHHSRIDLVMCPLQMNITILRCELSATFIGQDVHLYRLYLVYACWISVLGGLMTHKIRKRIPSGILQAPNVQN